MLDIQIKIEGDKILLEGLNQFAIDIPHAIQRALERLAKGIYRESYGFLSGPGSKKSRKIFKRSGKMRVPEARAGSYPVPVVTGHLRRMLNWLRPGETKKGEVGTFTAGPHETVVYDSALYANVIHEGKGSSAKYGPRRYLTDAFMRFNQGARIKGIMEEEIRKAKGNL